MEQVQKGNPQVKVIADFPGNKDFEIGSTLTLDPYNQYYWKYEVKDCQGERIYLLEFFEKYPYLFEIVGREKAKQPAPAIGARWVRASEFKAVGVNSPKYDDADRILILFPYDTMWRFGIASHDDGKWYYDNDYEVGQETVNQMYYLSESPATFPTREQADAVGFLQWWCKELHLGNIGWCATPDSWILHKKEGRPIVTTEKLYAIYRQVSSKP